MKKTLEEIVIAFIIASVVSNMSIENDCLLAKHFNRIASDSPLIDEGLERVEHEVDEALAMRMTIDELRKYKKNK